MIFGGASSIFTEVGRVTASGAAAVDFTGLRADRDYLLIYGNVRPGTGGDSFHMRFSTDGGSTFDTSADHGSWFYDGALAVSNSATSVKIGGAIPVNAAASMAGFAFVLRSGAQDRRAVTFQNYQADASANYRGSFGSGLSANPGGSDIDALRVLASTGTITGEFRLHEGKA
jgi:hypothetical protein